MFLFNNYSESIFENHKPPALFQLMESIVNYEAENQTRIYDLAEKSSDIIFDFQYPLSNKIDKKTFEKNILNHFIMRRIGFDTLTAFKIHLCTKLNEVMPKYNLMFDSLVDWNLFEDGEVTTRELAENSKNDASNNLENNSKTTGHNTDDLRNSEMPQNELEDIRNGQYLTNYSYNNNDSLSEDVSNSKGTSTAKQDRNLIEKTKRSNADKMSIYLNFQNEVQSILTLIYKDLEPLFYGLVD